MIEQRCVALDGFSWRLTSDWHHIIHCSIIVLDIVAVMQAIRSQTSWFGTALSLAMIPTFTHE